MGVREIRLWPDPVLSETCTPVGADEDLSDLIADMFETMYAAPGRGLAAPQIGVTKRLFVTDTTWKEDKPTPMAFINPEITDHSETLSSGQEGCLSIPGILVEVSRPEWVELAWTDPDGAARQQRFQGFAAACVQHELDHLNGTVTFDRLPYSEADLARAAYEKSRA
ncbi:peptide deformylase [Heliomarina baculiformis]|uniref:peptide deformylase n=1 Tax=Heliomarina baculiformis TaxID=2872036 RepID=UPI001EE37A02|nr:peptide deformylase [Heliomarina baculiformis]